MNFTETLNATIRANNTFRDKYGKLTGVEIAKILDIETGFRAYLIAHPEMDKSATPRDRDAPAHPFQAEAKKWVESIKSDTRLNIQAQMGKTTDEKTLAELKGWLYWKDVIEYVEQELSKASSNG